MKIEKLIIVIVAGVILADLVAHVAGTKAVFSGLNMLWSIGTQPTNTANIKTTPVANTSKGG
jgi:hypothetical protein